MVRGVGRERSRDGGGHRGMGGLRLILGPSDRAQRLRHGGPQLGGGDGITQDRERAQTQRFLGSLGVRVREEKDDRHLPMLSPHVGQKLQGVGIGRIRAGEDHIDPASLHLAGRDPIVGGFIDHMPQRFEHR